METLKISIITMLMMLAMPGLRAQVSDKQRAANIFRSVLTHYRQQAGLRFSMTYKYAAEGRPGQVLDSLTGDFSMAGESYHYRLDSTEVIGGKEMSVVIFHEDRLMYLVRPSSLQKSRNPMALLDSMLLKNDSITCKVEETNDWQSITLTFQPGGSTKRVEYLVDRHTGYVARMINVVPAKALYDPSVQSLVDNNGTYAIVETDFSEYRQDDTVAGELNINRYIKKEGKEYTGLPPYSSYKIIAGNPDLQ